MTHCDSGGGHERWKRRAQSGDFEVAGGGDAELMPPRGAGPGRKRRLQRNDSFALSGVHTEQGMTGAAPPAEPQQSRSALGVAMSRSSDALGAIARKARWRVSSVQEAGARVPSAVDPSRSGQL